jgi:hypothetical protein
LDDLIKLDEHAERSGGENRPPKGGGLPPVAHPYPIGGPKAQFFFSVGFRDAVALENALLELAWTGDVASMTTSAHGVKYAVDGVVSTPAGRLVKLRTIWIVERAHEGPRFVTAYPF